MSDAADGADELVSGVTSWFSSDGPGEGPHGWRLDVVTLLAVIGESSVADHAQTITASKVCLLPRIIPAPQAFMKPSRPARLPESTAKIAGVYSGVNLDTLGFFANIIHPLEALEPLSFQFLEIRHATDEDKRKRKEESGLLGRLLRRRGASKAKGEPRRGDQDVGAGQHSHKATGFRAQPVDVEAGAARSASPQPGIVRRPTRREQAQDLLGGKKTTGSPPAPGQTKEEGEGRPMIPPSRYSPVHILSVFSCLLTLGVVGIAAWQRDGTAIVSVALMSLSSSVSGAASWWRPLLMKREQKTRVPDGDVVIRTREGAFLLVRCTEEVARELYAGTEECHYRVAPRPYRVLMSLATLLLMVSVILLGNCKWYTQVAIGASYILLNALYWMLGLIPKRRFWDVGRYVIEDLTRADARIAEKEERNFTKPLWYAIRETKQTAWVERSGAAPVTPQWKKWLREAREAAEDGDRRWDAIRRKNEIMGETDDEALGLVPVGGQTGAGGDAAAAGESKAAAEAKERSTHGEFDQAQQVAPATQVQPISTQVAYQGTY